MRQLPERQNKLDTQDLKVYLLCRYANESSLYSSWISQLPCAVEVVDSCPANFNPPADCGIVIAHEHYRWEECSAIKRIYEQRRIPVLVLADGVLEYRNTWQNPTIPDASMYQPLLADKIACIGDNTARMIQSWGNVGKVEVVGLPRLDEFIEFQPIAKDPNVLRLVIATANTPAFTEQQHAIVLKSIQAIKAFLTKTETLDSNQKIEVEWRLSAELDVDAEINQNVTTQPLIESIKQCDAVITTPSTIYLESVLLKKPTAILDFSNSPQFTPSAWTITAPDHIESTINELAEPSNAKMLYQDFVLNDCLRCDSPAAPRMVRLVTEMIKVGARQHAELAPIEMPARILDSTTVRDQTVVPNQNYANELFKTQDKQRLQAELSQAVHRLGTLPQELSDKNHQIAQLQSALDESRHRVADVRARLFKLRKILGIGKENQTEDLPGQSQSE